MRQKFNLCLESVVKNTTNMRVIKMKELWAPQNQNLVNNNKITRIGLSTYWKSVDAAFRFNIQKREEYMTREKARLLNFKFSTMKPLSTVNSGANGNIRSTTQTNRNEVNNFFRRKSSNDRFHWSRESVNEDGRQNQNNRDVPRFILPRPSQRR